MSAYREAASKSGCDACAERARVPWWRSWFFQRAEWRESGWEMRDWAEGVVGWTGVILLGAAIVAAIGGGVHSCVVRVGVAEQTECRERCAFHGGTRAYMDRRDCLCRISTGEVRTLK